MTDKLSSLFSQGRLNSRKLMHYFA